MTYKEKLKQIDPDALDDTCDGGCVGCPSNYPELNDNGLPKNECTWDRETCTRCWNREIPGTEEKSGLQEAMEKIQECVIKDSGSRQEFTTGAVRDIQKGKGRCDLMPLDVVAALLDDGLTHCLEMFKVHGDVLSLEESLKLFTQVRQWDVHTMLLEVAKHFEEGAEKYGENNWQKGLPVKCYINSAIRHYLKWLRGDKDEPHDRAFCWNIMCAIWTCKHKPELNDYTVRDEIPGQMNLFEDGQE